MFSMCPRDTAFEYTFPQLLKELRPVGEIRMKGAALEGYEGPEVAQSTQHGAGREKAS